MKSFTPAYSLERGLDRLEPGLIGRRERGLSLIELMVAMLLGIMLLFSITQIFAGNKQSNTTQQSFARVQESGRTATELLMRDLRISDHWGCLHDRSKIVNHLDTGSALYVDWKDGAAVGGDNDAAATLGTIGNKQVLAGTDTITIRTSTDLCAGKGRLKDGAAGQLIASSGCPISAGQTVVVSNCKAGELFTVSAYTASSGLIEHSTTYENTAAIKNASDFAADSPAYGADSRLLQPLRRTYFLAAGSNGVPSLYRCDNRCGDAEELVPGIENLQIEYGEDTNGDGVVDIYHTANAVTNSAHVATVRLRLIVRGNEIVNLDKNNAPYNDGLLRKSFAAVANIRNRSLN